MKSVDWKTPAILYWRDGETPIASKILNKNAFYQFITLNEIKYEIFFPSNQNENYTACNKIDSTL